MPGSIGNQPRRMLKQTAGKSDSAVISVSEIERKWLVSELPDLSRHASQAIRQGYLVVDADGTEERIRERAGRHYFTRKGPGTLERTEDEREISREEFISLWDQTEGRRVEKSRYQIPYHGSTIEIDVYGGALSGLVVAEVEFSSLREAAKFSPPPWFGREVTDDPAYKNRSLSRGEKVPLL